MMDADPSLRRSVLDGINLATYRLRKMKFDDQQLQLGQ